MTLFAVKILPAEAGVPKPILSCNMVCHCLLYGIINQAHVTFHTACTQELRS